MLHPLSVWAMGEDMSLLARIVIVALCLWLPLASQATPAPPKRMPNITIIADSSLMLALADLSRLYARLTNTPVTVIRDHSADPARQLEQGFDAHILLSADPTLVERLAQRGLIDVFGTQHFARTQLALAAPARMKKELAVAQRISFAALLFAKPEIPIYMRDPTTPDGLRAQSLMEGREFSHELSTRAEIKPSREAIISALRDTDGFALMLASDAIMEPELTVLSLLPATSSDPVRYDAVVLASEHMDQARKFTKFLHSGAAQNIFLHYGFQPPAQE